MAIHIKTPEEIAGLRIAGAIYHTHSGKVDFLE